MKINNDAVQFIKSNNEVLVEAGLIVKFEDLILMAFASQDGRVVIKFNELEDEFFIDWEVDSIEVNGSKVPEEDFWSFINLASHEANYIVRKQCK